MKKSFYKNGFEMLSSDFSKAKGIILNDRRFRGKISNYFPLTKIKTLPQDLVETDRFIVDELEFVVFNYKSISFSLDSMSVSENKKAIGIYWQRVK